MRIPWLLVLSFVSLLTACAHPFARVQSPSVSVAQFQLLDAKVLEQRYRLQLRIQNPNSFALPIAGMHYRLFLNGVEFARGVSNQSVNIPAFSERTMEVDMVSTIGTVIDQIQRWKRDSENGLRYRLAGEADVATSFAPVSFEYRGVIPLDTPLIPY